MKPSFGQVLGYIQEGEPLALDLPKRNASIYTSSHFYLNNFPNASEPLSDAPMPHTTLNPAAAFETADEVKNCKVFSSTLWASVASKHPDHHELMSCVTYENVSSKMPKAKHIYSTR